MTKRRHDINETDNIVTDQTGPTSRCADDQRDVDLLVVNGGDGTLQYALTEILGNGAFGDRIPMIAPLRAGRTNMSAMDLGARKDPLRGIGELIACAEDGRIAEG